MSENAQVVMTTEEFIADALQQYNLSDARIAEIKAYCDALSIAGPEDAEGYKAVAKALTSARKVRTSIESKRKDLKAVALEYGRAVDGEAKRLTSLVQPIEDRLAVMKAEVDQIAEQKRQARIASIKSQLAGAGYLFDGYGWKIGSLIVYEQQIQDIDEPTLEQFLAQGRAELERLRAEEAARRAEAERIAAEQAAAAAAAQPVAEVAQASEPIRQTVHATTPPPAPAPLNIPSFQAPAAAAPVRTVSADFVAGFEAGKQSVLDLLAQGPTTRNELIANIQALKP